MRPEKIIELLDLKPLAEEGGMYRYVYAGALDENGRERYSSIYYLLTENMFSHMHKLETDEIYHYYMGDGLELLLLFPDGTTQVQVIGNDLEKGELPQFLVPAGVWQGSRVVKNGTFSLVGTTMAPAYIDKEYEQGVCERLCRAYPDVKEMICARCAMSGKGK